MERQSWSPAIVVGIDFGLTYTGVAYSSEDSLWSISEVLQTWPEREGALFVKYPSRVGYDKDGQAIDWGPCNSSKAVVRRESEFKLHLDPNFAHDLPDDPSNGDAMKFYTDYMTMLHQHLNTKLSGDLVRWSERNVEFRFSVPTTWKSSPTINLLKECLAGAGFVNTSNRRVVFTRTEAEAAAIHVSSQFKTGDVVMVVDAGGATTDINILEVVERTTYATQFLALDTAENINIGSVGIDIDVREFIENELVSKRVHSETQPKWLAEQMMKASGFEYYKSSFDPKSQNFDFYMQIPGRSDESIIIQSAFMEQIFDHLVQDLAQFVSDRLSALAYRHSRHRLNYMLLCGGLGSSLCVRQKLAAKFCVESYRVSNASGIRMLETPRPQLAVVKGLVMDWSQTLNHNIPVYTGRCCRVSYGVLCRLRYDSTLHIGEPIVRDPLTGEVWIEDQIDWLIKEGQVVPDDGLIKPYSLSVSKDKRYEAFRAHIVVSELPASLLPASEKRGPVKRLCTVEGEFSPNDFAKENPKGVSNLFRKKDHDVIHFNLKIIIGTTDLQFELVSLEGYKYSHNAAKVRVIWSEAGSSASALQAMSRIELDSHSQPFPS